MRYIIYFVVSLVIEFVYFFFIKKNTGVEVIDMLIYAVLFTLIMFVLDLIKPDKNNGKSD
ncbi:hypothetical protein ABNB59_05140 [Paenibacillus larvae]|uniref:Uncharacterized protein n=4 Tax=Paenibacillus larvae TaxID=1464 RepID=V9W2Y4_9BACL|nr:hypothetical protein [Paenibacillus larvae]AHD04513.1 hypothetical protein ERIC2_c06720 [Paenibacillus larvae subsp. larvae DSM 25430]ETK29880.1 hypothetical protein ERIC1_1c34390 [Paenibacillus larvae subsp. larvae DSM 25719]AVF23525.1 hypothetical protein ERICI_03786 [Paenibacillus larvae subsp. larvae]AVF29875.1 hypothetical protein ERICIV_00907 [Paenibacillus larvae subsp. larvae]AVG11116.1 hypothetical protein ERICII_00679 [Paenibacillus larvae subsp. larvae DSM 25430]